MVPANSSDLPARLPHCLDEGIVSKRIGSRYVSGRTRAWLKTKNPNFER
jgi:hypothetical protein